MVNLYTHSLEMENSRSKIMETKYGYQPRRMAQAYEAYNGDALLDWLIEHRILLEVASDLGRPAVEAIGCHWRLPKAFPAILKGPEGNRARQLIGALVRFVLENESFGDGYKIRETNSRTAIRGGNENIFTTGARYDRVLPH
jgi:hypothetical protein